MTRLGVGEEMVNGKAAFAANLARRTCVPQKRVLAHGEWGLGEVLPPLPATLPG